MSAEVKPLNGSAPQARKRLGEIFIEQKILTEVAVERLVALATSKNMRLGELLEVIGLITPKELAEALAIQYRCRTLLDFARYSYTPEVLRTIPLEMAVNNCIFPLKIDDGKLGLAVADPTTESLFEELAARLKLKLVLYLSTRSEINRGIARHYLGHTPVEQTSKSILLVEDDLLSREMVARLLTKNGYQVETAADGMEAFTKIFACKPKLVITDKVMPKLGGYEFLFAIRNIPEFRFMPVILMTAAATPDEEKEALERGFFDFVMKPVKEIGLMTRVQRAFESSERLYGKVG
jgi:CheY-like chemotaxis protein